MRDDMAGGRGGRAAVAAQSSPKSGGESAKEIVTASEYEVNGSKELYFIFILF